MAIIKESEKSHYPMSIYRDGVAVSHVHDEHADRFGNGRNQYCEYVDSFTRRPTDAEGTGSPASPVKRG